MSDGIVIYRIQNKVYTCWRASPQLCLEARRVDARLKHGRIKEVWASSMPKGTQMDMVYERASLRSFGHTGINQIPGHALGYEHEADVTAKTIKLQVGSRFTSLRLTRAERVGGNCPSHTLRVALADESTIDFAFEHPRDGEPRLRVTLQKGTKHDAHPTTFDILRA